MGKNPAQELAYTKAILLLDEPGAKFSPLPHATRVKELGKADNEFNEQLELHNFISSNPKISEAPLRLL